MAADQSARPSTDQRTRRPAITFIVPLGVVSFSADFTHAASRSVLGWYLGALGASATVVGLVTGLGKLLGYGLRLVSGRWADATGPYNGAALQ
ncbi:MAG: hypothetical protein JSR99_00040 [Proteobacteria bacterium]|nr:hypothetical protein [Pseudomonadota bacterium]